jgi:hypothetical protein
MRFKSRKISRCNELVSMLSGRPSRKRAKGCIMLKRGTRVDIVDRQEESTEIVIRGKHWFTDE